MTIKSSEKSYKREKPIVGKLSFTDEDVRNSKVLKKQIERGKRRLKEIHFPPELLK